MDPRAASVLIRVEPLMPSVSRMGGRRRGPTWAQFRLPATSRLRTVSWRGPSLEHQENLNHSWMRIQLNWQKEGLQAGTLEADPRL